ncbi:MAG: SDR family NAD(P)-dependent oxidoreductase, partial [Actinomycetota bacterium]
MKSGILDGRIVLVTGGGSGLGASFARRLAADGAHVVVGDVNETGAGQVASEIGGEAAVFDVTDSSAFDAVVDRVVAHHGHLDVLINNAGIARPSDPERTQISFANQALRMEGRLAELTPIDATVSLTDEAWHRMMNVHVSGTFYGTRAALRHMTPR